MNTHTHTHTHSRGGKGDGGGLLAFPASAHTYAATWKRADPKDHHSLCPATTACLYLWTGHDRGGTSYPACDLNRTNTTLNPRRHLCSEMEPQRVCASRKGDCTPRLRSLL
jgi:hypothetical protein